MSITASTILTTHRGSISVYYHTSVAGDCVSFVVGDVTDRRPILVRLHSSCMFGEIFGSSHCDCGAQINAALDLITEAQCGVLIYLFQEGRGIGLQDKIRAMELQRCHSLNTVEAFRQLGYTPDPRSYMTAVDALHDLEIFSRIHLISNNPVKQKSLEKLGFTVEQMVPLAYSIPQSALADIYTKVTVFGHTIDLAQINITNDYGSSSE